MNKNYPRLLVADKKGSVYDVPFLQGTGMKACEYYSLYKENLVKLHPDSELFMLTDRHPIGFDPRKSRFVQIEHNPLINRKEPCYAVAAFLPPGYTATYSSAYWENDKTSLLPLFSYAAVVFYKDAFYATGVRVDREKRQELKGMNMEIVKGNVKIFRKMFPKNRLVEHIVSCALLYGCPAAKNFFLKRYEGPLPSSPTCNARCLGCISYQPGKGCSVTQPRIKFVPTPEEIAEVALFHIKNVKDAIVSFGQGCEGEPLMVSDVLEKAVCLIRKGTSKGLINLNTNASKPEAIIRLFRAGLNSIRVSVNSFQKTYYERYYMPQGYSFREVVKSIGAAKRAGGFVSINYLTLPGFNDSEKEVFSLKKFLDKTNIDMIQWRNLNYDPMVYFEKLGIKPGKDRMIGIDVLIKKVKKEYPQLMHGYFNPSFKKIKRSKNNVLY
ncbi:MAG: radical SAM protein [Candidatus Omnitrophota bacterium]|nr:radical SAM protein [Candidatus Omnitrophota bacterium]MBU1894400.1 radical SAM protein [Candidatus Omnitrophota bacterium]